MQAIRAINQSAQLVQTEDVGRTYSTPALAYQAEMENHRRVLSFDLLTGAVGARSCAGRLLSCVTASREADLEWFVQPGRRLMSLV